jgi:hypothetical protein
MKIFAKQFSDDYQEEAGLGSLSHRRKLLVVGQAEVTEIRHYLS